MTSLPPIESAFTSPPSDSDVMQQVTMIKKKSVLNKPDQNPFSYRHYVTFHPAQNKILEKRWDERTRELHLKRLKEARPSIDNSPPKVYPHLELRLKRLKLEERTLFF